MRSFITIILGVTAGNIAIYRFIYERPWFDSIGAALTAGAITAALVWAYTKFRGQ